MACTIAVEELIGQHYNNQLKELLADDPEAHKVGLSLSCISLFLSLSLSLSLSLILRLLP